MSGTLADAGIGNIGLSKVLIFQGHSAGKPPRTIAWYGTPYLGITGSNCWALHDHYDAQMGFDFDKPYSLTLEPPESLEAGGLTVGRASPLDLARLTDHVETPVLYVSPLAINLIRTLDPEIIVPDRKHGVSLVRASDYLGQVLDALAPTWLIVHQNTSDDSATENRISAQAAAFRADEPRALEYVTLTSEILTAFATESQHTI